MIYMLYMDGCPGCNHFKDLITQYKIENKFTFININDVKIAEDVLLSKHSKKISFPTFFVIDKNNEKKIISRILLKEYILGTKEFSI
jgi:glutaredoxin